MFRFIQTVDKLLQKAPISPQRATPMEVDAAGPSRVTPSPQVQPKSGPLSPNVTVRQRRTATPPTKTHVIPRPSVIPRSQGKILQQVLMTYTYLSVCISILKLEELKIHLI